MNDFVPISRFNRGEANKIFYEVKEKGIKIVVKNNVPVCVLVEPKRYEAMVEALEDYELFIEAEKRMKAAQTEGFISSNKVMAELNIDESELDNVNLSSLE